MSWTKAATLLQTFVGDTRALAETEAVTEERYNRLMGALATLDQDALAQWKRELVAEEVQRLADIAAWEARNEVTVRIRRPTEPGD